MTNDDIATVIKELSDRVAGLVAVAHEHQAHIFAIESYVAAQPGYNAGLFGRSVAAMRADALKQIQSEGDPVRSVDSSLRALLEAVKGPRH